jgi:hypothetical protein
MTVDPNTNLFSSVLMSRHSISRFLLISSSTPFALWDTTDDSTLHRRWFRFSPQSPFPSGPALDRPLSNQHQELRLLLLVVALHLGVGSESQEVPLYGAGSESHLTESLTKGRPDGVLEANLTRSQWDCSSSTVTDLSMLLVYW